MKALISPNEPVQSGYRIAQISDDDQVFDVAKPLFWVDCSSEIKAPLFWYDPADQTIKPIPQDITEA